MLSLDLYIHGTGSISPAADAPDTPLKRLAAEPDYTRWIPPVQLRRTSKVVRMGIGAAKLCTEASGIERPDAISIGTAMGCLQDTEVFLNKLVSQDEKMLTPTAFIQSTHNTVGGQIALLMGCRGHNMTYVHRGHSFEHAIINTKLYLNDHPGETVLAGGIDELTNTSHVLMQRAGFYQDETNDAGVIAGEGAAFFALNEQANGALLRLKSIHLFEAANSLDALAEVTRFLNNLPESTTIDQLFVGNNGGAQDESFYAPLIARHPAATLTSFKKSCGEYPTAVAYALSLLAVQAQEAQLVAGNHQPASPAQNLPQTLIINHYCDHYSCWLVECC